MLNQIVVNVSFAVQFVSVASYVGIALLALTVTRD
jgi:hypothetical protein